VERELDNAFKEILFSTEVPENTAVTRSQMAGEPLNRFAPRSAAALAYQDFTAEVLKRLRHEK